MEEFGGGHSEVLEQFAMIVTNSENLYFIDDLIHDRWFSTNDIDYDADIGELRLYYADEEAINRRKLCSVKGQPRAWQMVVKNVLSYQFKDSQRVLWYDFNRIRYSRLTGWLDVLTNIPIVIRVKVSALDVEVRPYPSVCQSQSDG